MVIFLNYGLPNPVLRGSSSEQTRICIKDPIYTLVACANLDLYPPFTCDNIHTGANVNLCIPVCKIIKGLHICKLSCGHFQRT